MVYTGRPPPTSKGGLNNVAWYRGCPCLDMEPASGGLSHARLAANMEVLH